ncbi:DNAJ domain and SANT domain containing protein [Cryptosporidium canis]|uniref:DNAJ domain and SANT domain containing protein n=1 Tax=Cryptosporidium canis TaxID=195482 RepID=A0A9D5HV90_9CRYT|nr:DNAJ domain and SANT domain containing protein [Cryptosporidium canis]
MEASVIFALPPIPTEIFDELVSGPAILSSVAEFVFKRRVEPAGEEFFCRYERRGLKKVDNIKEETICDEYNHLKDSSVQYGDKKKSRVTSGNKPGNQFNNGVITLARLKELVEEKVTLYEKLGLNENVGVREIKQAYRRLALSYHPDKNVENGSEARSDEFLKIQEAYEVLSNDNLRHAYDSALPFDESVPSIYTNERGDFNDFKNFFSPIFTRNSRWSVYKPVPDIGNEEDSIEVVEHFYDFWRKFQSNRDFSIHDEHELNLAECREEKRWMERQNSKIRSKYIKNEISRINKLVELAFKNDPRIKKHYENLSKRKEEDKRKKLEEKRIEEERKRQMDEELKKKAIELKTEIKTLRVSIRNKMRKIYSEDVLFDKYQFVDISGCLENINEYLNWDIEFLKGVHPQFADKRQHNEKVSFKRWEDWFLKLDKPQLEHLDEFLGKWIESKGENCIDEYLKELYFIFTIKISNANKSEIEKSQGQGCQINEINTSSHSVINVEETSEDGPSSLWTVSEMSLLAKALQKYPGGFKNRWDMISEYLKNTKTKEQILVKVKELSESEKLANLSNEVSEESAFETFVQSNKGVLKKFGNTPDIRDCVDCSATDNSISGDNPIKVNDVWTKDQQCLLEKALKQYPSSLPQTERWNLISSCIPGKNPSQCLSRFKFIKERILKKNSIYK